MLKINVKNTKRNNYFFTSLPEQQNIIEALYALILILLLKYLIVWLIFIQNLIFLSFKIYDLLRITKLSLTHTFYKSVLQWSFGDRSISFRDWSVICHKSSQIRLMINHMFLKIRKYYHLNICLIAHLSYSNSKKLIFEYYILLFNSRILLWNFSKLRHKHLQSPRSWLRAYWKPFFCKCFRIFTSLSCFPKLTSRLPFRWL